MIVITTSFSGCTIINAGESGFKKTLGEITSKEALTEGIYFYNPITNSIVKYDIRNRVYNLRTSLYSKDNQPIEFRVSITYHLNKDKIIDIERSTGRDYEEKLFAKNANGLLKNIVGKIPTDDIVTNREKIQNDLKGVITDILSPYGIEVVFVNLDDVDYSDAYEKAITEKQIALQNSQKEKNETARIAENAKQQVIKAEAEANAKLAMAKADAQAILMKNEAEARGIELKNKALESAPKLVEYTLACQWDGKMPTTVMGSGSTPIALFNTETK